MSVRNQSGLEPVQGGTVTVYWDRSDTELARVIAAAKGWQTSGDRILDPAGNLIARSIEDAAAAMKELQWFVGSRSVFWSKIEIADPAAVLRGSLDDQGRHLSLVDD